jgi:hypothetical protein
MSETLDWTRHYREAWRLFRNGCAWQLLAWALDCVHPDDPLKLRLAIVLGSLAKRESARLSPWRSRMSVPRTPNTE